MRQFLLTNLEKPKGGKEDEFFKFRLPLNYLTKALEEIGDFPFDSNQNQCLIPSLFLKGTFFLPLFFITLKVLILLDCLVR